jgi:cardiolipin synthase (CMP-forming)
LLKHLPNFLSLLRLAAAPLAAWLIVAGHDMAALLVFAACGLSDGLDGFIARKWQVTSRFGAWLDPAADKLLMILCFLALLQIGVAPWWLVALVLLRDACIALGWVLVRLLSLPVQFAASRLGKASTLLQILYVGFWLLLLAFMLEAPRLMLGAAFVTAAITVLSGLGYALILLRTMFAGQRPG